MPLPTQPVTCRFYDQSGNPAVGARVLFRLTVMEIYDGIVAPELVEATTDVNGECVVSLFPNALGSYASQYQVRAWSAEDGKKIIDSLCTVPDQACLLHEILNLEPYPPIDSALQAMLAAQSALSDVTNQRLLAETAATSAASDAAVASSSATSASGSATAASGYASSAAGSAIAADASADAAAASAASVNDANLVHKTGNETIADTKTFTQPIVGSITGNAATATTATTASGLVAGADLSGLTQFGKSLSASGYQKLPGGLIVQWGGTTTSASGVVNTTLAIAFPSVFLASVGNSRDTANNVIVQTNSASLTQIGVSAWNTSNARVVTTTFWFAIGY